MSAPPSAERHIAELMATLGVSDTILEARASLRPSSPRTMRFDPEALPLLSVAAAPPEGPETPADRAELELRSVLGEGGMGIVHLATQRPLAREVAVKSVRGVPGQTAGQSEASVGLIQEALVTGALEHPNVVPVHALGRDRAGRPLLVMKRIEGTAWRELLHDDAHPFWAQVHGDRLEWHLGVLQQVAQAVHFAHRRGYVHRDLKPENVMIGSYGEVYVVDWGLAVRLDELPRGAAHRARQRGRAGRP